MVSRSSLHNGWYADSVPNVAEPADLTDKDQELIQTESKINELKLLGDRFHRAVGCEHCHSGHKGRIGIFEALVPDQALYDAMMQGGS